MHRTCALVVLALLAVGCTTIDMDRHEPPNTTGGA